MSGRLALEPELVARPAEERHQPRFDGLAKGLIVHKADHEDAMRLMILNHRGDQSTLLAEIEFHSSIPTKKPTWLSAGSLRFQNLIRMPPITNCARDGGDARP